MAQRTSSQRRILAAVFIGAIIVIFGASGGLGPLRWVYDHTFIATDHALSGSGSSFDGFFSALGAVSSLSIKNDQLVRENADLRGRLASTADAARENAQLRRELGLKTVDAPKQIGADVVSFQPDSYRQFVTLNRGSIQGVAVGQAALSNGVVVGTISSVSSTTSQLQLVSDPEFALAVQDQETGAQGVAHGQLGGGINVERFAETDVVHPHDTIATSGLGGTVPRGLLLGQVESVNALTGGIFKTAHVPTTLQPNQLRFVFVAVGQ
jgi:rod shape-determining protein MreC